MFCEKDDSNIMMKNLGFGLPLRCMGRFARQFCTSF